LCVEHTMLHLRGTMKQKNVRRLYSSAFLVIMLCALCSQAFHHTHSHHDTSHIVSAEHMYAPGGDEDCAQMVSCDHSHDSQLPGFFSDDPGHYAIVPTNTVPLVRMAKSVEPIETDSVRIDLRALSTPFPPPKLS
jgi:hypothetical protein